MRFVTATGLAIASALCVAQLHAQQPPAGQRGGGMQMPDTARKVPGGGIHAPGWQGKPDAGTGSINDSKFDLKGTDIEISTGPAAVYWNAKDTASGDYTVSATFTEPHYMSSNDHPHPYGVFIAGNKLDTDQPTLLYCAAYGDGRVIVRAFPTSFAPGGSRRAIANEAVHKAADKGAPVTQTVAMSVKGDKVECSVNGATVATLNKSDLVGAGKLDSTDGAAGIRVAHNVDVVVKDFKVSK